MVALGIVVVLPCIFSGLAQTYSAVALPQMNLNVADVSWFASVPGFASPFGALILSIILDKFGRRAALLSSTVPHVVGWLLIYVNYNATVTILGRLVTGIMTGILFYPGQVYTSECLTVNYAPRVRNYFATIAGVTQSLGIILTYALGCFSSYLTVAGCAVLLSIGIFVMLFVLVPESPAWLRSQGRVGDAEVSQRRLGLFQPMLEVSKGHDAVAPVATVYTFRWSAIKSGLLRMAQKDVRKPAIVMTILMALVACTGGMVLISYMVDIIGDDPNGTQDRGTSSYAYSVISGILVLVARVLISFTLPHFGGRKVMIWSCIIFSVGMFVVGDTLLAADSGPGSHSQHVAAVWLVTFFYNYGILTVPMYMMSDVFPKDAKGFAGIPVLSFLVSNIATIALYPHLSAYYGGYLYYGYAAASAVCAIFVFLFLPDVIGKTVEEISEELTK